MPPAPQVILASASPRRRELLPQLGIAFQCHAADIDEAPLPGETAADLTRRLALAKARAGAAAYPDNVVIGADTVVAVDRAIFGKPRDQRDGTRMLAALSARAHHVVTAVAVVSTRGEDVRSHVSQVWFRALHPAEIDSYWSTGEPIGKAGAYAIQGRAARFIEKISGSYSGIMGLPLFETAQLLARHGVEIP